MAKLRTKKRVTDVADADASASIESAPITTTKPRRVIGNPAALGKAVFESRDTREVGLQASIKALLLMDRLRFVRTIDLAFHLYSKRTFTAALAAANNLLKRLTRNGFVNAHTARVGGLRIYGIAQRGVNFLRDNTGHEARAHRSLRDVKNPEHRLWANLMVIAAEVRGLTAMTESEVLRFEREHGEVVSDGRGGEYITPRKLISVVDRREPGTRKGLTPDATFLHGSDRTICEIDFSRRSSDRTWDLRAIVASHAGTNLGTNVGTVLFDGTTFSRLVIHIKERRTYTHIAGMLKKKSEERIELASTYLKPTVHEGVFDVYYHPSIAEDKSGRPAQDRRCGQVQVLMLPDIRGRGEGWYDQDWLPFAQLDEQLWLPVPRRSEEE